MVNEKAWIKENKGVLEIIYVMESRPHWLTNLEKATQKMGINSNLQQSKICSQQHNHHVKTISTIIFRRQSDFQK